MGYVDYYQIRYTKADASCVEGRLPLTENCLQPFGYMHGGVSMGFLETLASYGSELQADLENEIPFGVDVHFRHMRPLREGMLLGRATLRSCVASSYVGRKLTWDLCAFDEKGNTICEGSILVKIVPRDYLQQKFSS